MYIFGITNSFHLSYPFRLLIMASQQTQLDLSHSKRSNSGALPSHIKKRLRFIQSFISCTDRLASIDLSIFQETLQSLICPCIDNDNSATASSTSEVPRSQEVTKSAATSLNDQEQVRPCIDDDNSATASSTTEVPRSQEVTKSAAASLNDQEQDDLSSLSFCSTTEIFNQKFHLVQCERDNDSPGITRASDSSVNPTVQQNCNQSSAKNAEMSPLNPSLQRLDSRPCPENTTLHSKNPPKSKSVSSSNISTPSQNSSNTIESSSLYEPSVTSSLKQVFTESPIQSRHTLIRIRSRNSGRSASAKSCSMTLSDTSKSSSSQTRSSSYTSDQVLRSEAHLSQQSKLVAHEYFNALNDEASSKQSSKSPSTPSFVPLYSSKVSVAEMVALGTGHYYSFRNGNQRNNLQSDFNNTLSSFLVSGLTFSRKDSDSEIGIEGKSLSNLFYQLLLKYTAPFTNF